MSRADAVLAWGVVAVLGLALAARGLALRPGEGFATMPILTPTSLVYEAQLREERGQPAGMGGAEAVAMAEALLAAPASSDPAVAAEVEALAQDRAQLLSLRNRRHALNVAMMDVGVEVARRLRPAQWQAVLMGRDQTRAAAEAETFERLRRHLAEGAAPAAP